MPISPPKLGIRNYCGLASCLLVGLVACSPTSSSTSSSTPSSGPSSSQTSPAQGSSSRPGSPDGAGVEGKANGESVTLPGYDDGSAPDADVEEFVERLQSQLGLSSDELESSSGSRIRRTTLKHDSGERIPELVAGELPPLTRTQPDPAKTLYNLKPVFVRFSETLTRSSGETGPTKIPVVENYLKAYFRRAGHPIVATPEEAAYRVEGRFEGSYGKTVTFNSEAVVYQVEGSANLRLLDGEGKHLEEFALPPTSNDNSISENGAFLDLRRYISRLLWDYLSRESAYFGNSEVQLLLEALVAGDILDSEDSTDETVVQALAGHGFDAVPYLLDALTDVRTVKLPSQYPGVERFGAGMLKVYHVADKALEEIFQKVSRMKLTTLPNHRFVVMRGWENEWRRFCPSFRDSGAKR